MLIGQIFEKVMREYEEQSIADFRITEPLKVKRFVIPAMYLKEGMNIK
ncbi:hypothetical protein J34TS1_61710 [Paenibacillus azoreducens]|uniref:Uncharacterized protein n=1 Tax=Paenibacillus azoreducens TaxID=116718 RepID=A0A919YIQ4_9BACL|nr:hypothetical protein J34TS1_61710 [Paenibacillus azoreducens]